MLQGENLYLTVETVLLVRRGMNHAPGFAGGTYSFPRPPTAEKSSRANSQAFDSTSREVLAEYQPGFYLVR